MLKWLFSKKSKVATKPVNATVTKEPSFEDTMDKLIRKYIQLEYLTQYCPLCSNILINDPNKTYKLFIRSAVYNTKYKIDINQRDSNLKDSDITRYELNYGSERYSWLSNNELCKFILTHFDEVANTLQDINNKETKKVLDREQREQDFKKCTRKLIDKVNQNL